MNHIQKFKRIHCFIINCAIISIVNMSSTSNRHHSFYNKSKYSLVRNYKNITDSNATNDLKKTSIPSSSTVSNNQNGDQQQSTTPVKQFGVTSPISLAEPNLIDFHRTDKLHEFLASNIAHLSQDERCHRKSVLIKLNTLFKQWIKDISISRNMSVMAAEKLGGRILIFGSCCLDDHAKGADIDAVCAAPCNIKRGDYFSSFFQLLKEQAEVSQCRAIEEAFVPVIKMIFDGIEIDLLFARLAFKEIPKDLDLKDNSVLKNLDPYSVRSLNGVRVANDLLSLVPNRNNFRLTLSAIKLWAKKNGIYSNSVGYFGGVTWAMLVARVCQLYPNAEAATLVNKFFLVFSKWNWPNPVLLKNRDHINLNFPVWDPKVNVSDSYHLMPIITPSYPQQNSTFNVTESTKMIIVDEINRGLTITNEIMMGLAQWERLIEAPNFFHRYQYYLVLMVNSPSAEDHVNWCGFVESKLRFLITTMEQNPEISKIHVNPKCFEYQGTNTGTTFSSMWFLGLDIKRDEESLDVDLTQDVDYFYDIFDQQKMKAKMFNEDMNIEIRFVEHKSLPQYLNADFLKSEPKKLHSNLHNRKRPASDMIDSQSQTERLGKVKVRRLITY